MWDSLGMTTSTGYIVGYARVSTRHQNLERQLDALEAMGAQKVFVDKVTGRTMDRPGWEQCRSHLRPGDTLVVDALDRLGRSMIEVVQTLTDLTNDGVTVRDRGDRVLSTSDPMGKALVSIMAALAEMEVDLKAERASAAREAARVRGRQTGRPRAHTADVAASALAMRGSGATVAEVCKEFGIPRSTFYRYAKAAAA